MPNSFITLLDDKSPVTEATALQAISQVPFIQHQFAWLIQKLSAEPSTDAANTLSGYCGIKKLSPARSGRLAQVIAVIKAIPGSRLATLPDRITPGQKFPATS